MFKKFFEKKSVTTATVADLIRYGSDGNVTSAMNPEEMYRRLAIAFVCVEKIATEAEAFTFKVCDRSSGEELKNHPIHDLLFGRDLKTGGLSTFSSNIRDLLVKGEAFGLRMPYGEVNSSVVSLKSIFPNRVQKQTRNDDTIYAYDVNLAGMSINLPIDPITGFSDLLRISLYDSKSYIQGASPMEAAGIEGRLIDEGLQWNLSILAKGSKLSGIISGNAPTGMNEQQLISLQESISNMYAGSKNAGSVALISGDYKFNSIQMKPSDMDFQETVKVAMQNVAMAFKVPLPLIFEDASTLDNYKMAREEFILQTVIPHVRTIIETYNKWFAEIFGDNTEIRIDRESIEGLEDKRERKGKRLTEFVRHGILTPNEAREALGFERFKDPTADSLFMPSNQTPIEFLDGQSIEPVNDEQ